jgi:hypothetical protein
MFTNTFTYWCIGRNPGRFTQCFSEVTPDKFTYLAMRTENNEMSGGLLTYKHQQPNLNTPRLFIANESKLDSVQLQDLKVGSTSSSGSCIRVRFRLAAINYYY